MFVHDLTSLKIGVIEVKHASWFTPVLKMSLWYDTGTEYDSRTYTHHFFLVSDLGVRPMGILLHFFHDL
jgi:hypothetical protein